jgi:superfamily I DNA and/or RNA helicase
MNTYAHFLNCSQSNKLAKPPMPNSLKLAHQVIKYMKSNPHGIFREFNAPQFAAIEAALTRRMTMIQGPPGSGKTTVASAIAFGFAHQCRSLSSNSKVLACAFSNVGADNLAESLVGLGLKVVRVGKPSAVLESLWKNTLDAAIDRDPDAQKALTIAAKATAQLSKLTRSSDGRKNAGASLRERSIRDAATVAVKKSIEASNIAATRAIRDADVVVATSTGAADPRLLAACGLVTNEETETKRNQDKSVSSGLSASSSCLRVKAPDGGPALSLPFVLIDEACQSVEPASLVPIVSSNSCRSLVMLGDPCQLPPTVRSGGPSPLSISLMERLSAALPHPSGSSPVENILTDNSFLDALPVKHAKSLLKSRETGQQLPSYRNRFAGSIFLSIQYRMHPSIAAFPSAIFYDGLLSTPSFMKSIRAFPLVLNGMMPCGDPNVCVRFINVGGRSNERQGSPTRFSRTVFGPQQKSIEEQTSYWNEPEAERVVTLIKDILHDSSAQVKSIGVIAPYNGQVQLIKAMMGCDSQLRSLLAKRQSTTIEVKSVDGYQGRERDVIIFSTVRSNRQGRIGFLRDWRRMNVALTRAKAGLIVIGDLDTLREADLHWDAFGKWASSTRCVVDDFDSPEDEPSL